jgi:hypothetical protein
MPIPCPTCEMKSACRVAQRCCRPQDSAHWVKEVQAAQPIFEAGANRLTAALSGLAAALQREAGE